MWRKEFLAIASFSLGSIFRRTGYPGIVSRKTEHDHFLNQASKSTPYLFTGSIAPQFRLRYTHLLESNIFDWPNCVLWTYDCSLSVTKVDRN